MTQPIIDVAEAIKGLNVESAYSGEGLTPWWHGLDRGNNEGALQAAVRDGMLTAVDARELAGLLWEPMLRKVYTEFGEVEGHRAIVRDDTGAALSVVSDRYSVVTNLSMAQVADSAFQGDARCTTAGVLAGGRVVFYAMKLFSFQVDGDPSPTDMYMVVTSSHDGKSSAKVLVSPIRVVCQNTLRAARHAAAFEMNIRHTGNVDAKMADAMTALKKTEEFGHRFHKLGNMMSATHYADEFGPVLAKVISATKKETDWLADQQAATVKGAGSWVPSPDMPLLDQLVTAAPYIPEDLVPERIRNERATMERLINAGTGVDGTALQGTAWGAYQGATEYLDHHKTTQLKDTEKSTGSDRRAMSILSGATSSTKSDVLDVILAQTDRTSEASALLG